MEQISSTRFIGAPILVKMNDCSNHSSPLIDTPTTLSPTAGFPVKPAKLTTLIEYSL